MQSTSGLSAAFAASLIVFGAAGAAQSPHPVANAADVGVRGRSSAHASIAASGGFVALAWGASTTDGTTDVMAAVSRDGGRTFPAPVRVNTTPGDARLSGEQPARVALVPAGSREPAVVVVWTARGDRGTRLLSARSDDGGRSFSRSAVVSGADAAGNRGWESTAADRNGRVLVAWLDHRELATNQAMADMPHDHAAAGAAAPNAAPSASKASSDAVARAQQSKLMIGSLDTASAPAVVAGGVCYCCKTSIVTGPDGSVYAAWRHVYPGNIRDIAFTASSDSGKTFTPPVRVSQDDWKLDGCPEDGPSLAADTGRGVHIIWPTLVAGRTPSAEPEMALFYAVSADRHTFSPRLRLPTMDTPHHPQIAIEPDGDIVAAWEEGVSGQRRVVWARKRSGAREFAREGVVERERAVYPQLTVSNDSLVLAWTRGPAASSSIGVMRIR